MSLGGAGRPDGRASVPGGLGGRVRRRLRLGRVGRGGLIVLAGVLSAALPGPMGLGVAAVGLMIILRNSYKARRAFVRFQRAHPRALSPVRRLLKRRPEVLPVAWQMMLRTERLIVPRGYRVAVRSRRLFRRRRRASTIVA